MAAAKKVAEAKKPTVTIDGKEYLFDDLSEEAKMQIGNLRATDAELQRLNNQRAMLQTARSTYAKELTALLA